MMLIRRTPVLTGIALLLVGGYASAEEVKASATVAAPTAEPAAVAPTAEAPAEPTAPAEPEAEPMAEPAPEPEVMETTAAPVEEAAAEEEEEEAGSGVSYLLFGDAFATMSTAQPGSGSSYHHGYTSNEGRNQDGFGLAWLGLDLAYDGGKLGVTGSVRAGSGVNRYFVDSRLFGAVSITQAFVTWKPTDALVLDLGMFGTLFGAEVVENWNNYNYTRGALYYGYQPFWHTGLRASYAISDTLTLKAMVVDDANQISLLQAPGVGAGNVNSTMQAGLQVAYASDGFTAALGTLQTLGESSASGFDRFVDLVAGYSTDKFGVLFNGDFNLNDGSDSSYLGLSLAARYFFIPEFGVALRGEFIKPDLSASNDELVTATLTFDVRPVSGADNLVLRWDNRVESQTAASAIVPFVNRDGGTVDAWFESTIGLVAYTSGAL